MLRNACLLAKIGADTAENERNLAKKLPKYWQLQREHQRRSAPARSARGPCGELRRRPLRRRRGLAARRPGEVLEGSSSAGSKPAFAFPEFLGFYKTGYRYASERAL